MPAKKVESLDDVKPNVFDALKRAYVQRGIVRRPKSSVAAAVDTKQAEKSASADHQKQPSKTKTPKKAAQPQSDDGSEKTTDKPGIKKSDESKSAKGPETLTELTENAHDLLFEASTVFPFTLFPDTIALDREKLTIANRFFWRTANITSTPVSEIMTVEANVGPFFGSIHLTFRFFADNQRTVNFLWRHDAIQLQRMLHGYIIAHRREIDTSKVDTEKLKKMLLDLGQGAPD